MSASLPVKLPIVESIPLQRAVLCMDCEMITAATNGHCPVCEGRGLVLLQPLLDLAKIREGSH